MKVQKKKSREFCAQTAIEYLLLFTIVAIVTFVGLKTTVLPRTGDIANSYFNKMANEIVGEAPPIFP